jgi:phytoene dehydrogenase-like protein
MSKPKVIIVGAGLAGLCCARRLLELGISFQILEASNCIGGRVQTDVVDGFVLDRGFQVLLTAYPEAKRVLDYEALQLGYFEPGALIRFKGKFHRFVDPWRRPRHVLSTAMSPVGSLSDKLKVARLRRHVCRGTLEQMFARPETTTMQRLQEWGFSDRIINYFFRPFLGGVFLENQLTTSSRKFEFVFRMFAEGEAALPARGMAAIVKQLASSLPVGTIRTDTRVESIFQKRIVISDGESFDAEQIVIACEQPEAARLLGQSTNSASHSVTCLYFAADHPPISEPILILNGEPDGPINNLSVPSQVSPNYAPAGKSLVSVSVLGGENVQSLQSRVRSQLRDWFGAKVDAWDFLAGFPIPFALPAQDPPALSPVVKTARVDSGTLICGDYCETASIQGAMVSGRNAADIIAHDVEY